MGEQQRGIVLGLAAYLLWGLFPLYWPLLEPSGAVEILAFRVLWSMVVVVGLLLVQRGRGVQRGRAVQRSGRLQPGRRLPRDRRALVLLSAAAVLIGVNWGVYIWAVNHNHVVETSLGYFINPLVSVALGVMVLGERLRRRQWAAIALALIGVVELTAAAGRPPWIALALAVSFGCYGLVKKIVGVPAVEGLVVETLALSPVALAFVLVLASTGRSTFVGHGAGHAALLATTGLVTVIPLLAFAGSAPRVPLSLLGVMQYLAPTVQFLIGVLVRHEPLPASTLVGFGFVWVALALFTVDHARSRRRLVTPLVGEVSDPSVISV